MGKIEHKESGICARIERDQDADNEDQKQKWILKVHKTYKLLREAYFQSSFSPSFYLRSILEIFEIPPPPPKMSVELKN